MKKGIILSILFLFVCANGFAQAMQELLIDCEKAGQQVKEMSFEGDNVILLLSDDETQKFDMSRVSLSFSFDEGSEVKESNLMTFTQDGNRIVVKQRNEEMMLYSTSSVQTISIGDGNKVVLNLMDGTQVEYDNSISTIVFRKYTDTYQANSRRYKDPSVTYVLNPNTKILSDYHLDHISEITYDNVLIFDSNTDRAYLPEVGDVYVYTQKNRVLRDGYIGRIKSVYKSGWNYRVVVEDVTISEVFKEFDYAYKYDLSKATGLYDEMGNLISCTKEDVEVSEDDIVPATSGSRGRTRVSGSFEKTWKVSLSTDGDIFQSTLSGEINLGGECDIKVTKNSMSFTMSPFFKLIGKLDISCNGELPFERTKKLLGTIPLSASVSNVILKPEIAVYAYCYAKAEMSAGIEFDFMLKKDVKLEYIDGKWSSEIADAYESAKPRFAFTGIEGSVEGGLGTRLLPGVKFLMAKKFEIQDIYVDFKKGIKSTTQFKIPHNFESTAYEFLRDTELELFSNMTVHAGLSLNTKLLGKKEDNNRNNKNDLVYEYEKSFSGGKFRLVPSFSDFATTPVSNTSQSVSVFASETTLLPVGMGFELYDTDNQLLKDYDGGTYWWQRIDKTMETTFDGLSEGKQYLVYPYVNIFGNKIKANRRTFTMGESKNEDDDTPIDYGATIVPNNNSYFYFALDDRGAYSIETESSCRVSNLSQSGHVVVPEIGTFQAGPDENPIYWSLPVTQVSIDDCPNISAITVPDGVYRYYIGNCPNLKYIKIPKSLKVLKDNGSFKLDFCDNLEIVDFPEGLEKIDSWAFRGKKKLKKVILPNSIQYVKSEAFGNSGIKELRLSTGMRRIEDATFTKCNNLEIVDIPDNIETIGDAAFSSCKGLKQVKLGQNVKTLGSESFSYDDNLRIVEFNDVLDEIGDGSFYDCYNLTEIKLPSSIKRIGKMAFLGCNIGALGELPASLTEIGDDAFRGCDIKKIVLPHTIVKLGKDAFGGSLEYADIQCNLPSEAFSGSSGNLHTIRFSNSITLGDRVFDCNSNICRISFDDCEVNSVGSNAFGSSWGINEVIINNRNPFAHTYGENADCVFEDALVRDAASLVTSPVSLDLGVKRSGGYYVWLGGKFKTYNGNQQYKVSTYYYESDGSVEILGEEWYEQGEDVKFVVTPVDGYILESLTVTCPDGYEVTVITDDEENFSFVMPKGEVTIRPIFAPGWKWLATELSKGGTVSLDKNYIAKKNDAGIIIPKGIDATLNLSGYILDRQLDTPTNNGYAIRVDGNLTIYGGGLIRGGNNLQDGGGIYVSDGATLNFADAALAYNYTSGNGGGIAVEGALVLEGSVTDNVAAFEGGGIFVKESETSSVKMDSGTRVLDNQASSFGGGISNHGNLAIQGFLEIKDNTKDDGETASNVYTANPIEITDYLSSENIGISPRQRVGASEVFTSGFLEHNPGENPDLRFISDDPNYTVILDDNEASLEQTIIHFSSGQKWATYYSRYDYEVPEGLTAYIVSGINESNINIVKANYIKANTALILGREDVEAKDYSLKEATGATLTNTGSVPMANFTGVLVPTEVGSLRGKVQYILVGDEFLKLEMSWTDVIAPHRCYIYFEDELGANTRSLSYGADNGTTSIISLFSEDQNPDVWYDIYGRRINRPTKKGIYIKSRKKIIKK